MKKSIVVGISLLFLSVFAVSEELKPITSGLVIAYQTEKSFEDVKEHLETAITNQGLVISSRLHIQDMLSRTAKDLGFAGSVFQDVESISFCSASLSHRMTQLSPLNATMCPFTITVYSKATEPKQVYVAFRNPTVAGDNAETLRQEIEDLFHRIVRQALTGEW